MELSEDVYVNVDVSADKIPNPVESEDIYEDVRMNEVNILTLKAEKSRRNRDPENSGGKSVGNRYYRPAAVCVGLLCILLLAGVIGLFVNRNQLQVSYNDLTKERDYLITKKEQLQTSYNDLTKERDYLITKKEQLQTSYNDLTKERDYLITKKEQLQTSYNDLTKERHSLDEARKHLQTRYNDLTTERDHLWSNYIDVANQVDKLNKNYNNLLASYNNMTNLRDQLQKERDELLSHLRRQGELQQEWSHFNGGLYYISNDTKTWNESRQDCRDRGADLVIINSREEQEFITGLSKNIFNSTWIGLTHNSTYWMWKWVDDTALNTRYWRSGQPYYYGYDGYDCVINFSGYNNLNSWGAESCHSHFYRICEMRICN